MRNSIIEKPLLQHVVIMSFGRANIDRAYYTLPVGFHSS